jgi:hypothetical protein
VPTHVNDLGAWRQLRKIHVNDLGTWRSIRFVWVNDLGTWRKVFSRDHSFSITVGDSGGGSFGYISGSFGAISGGTLDDGSTITGLYNATGDGLLHFSASGFSSDPGQSYFSSLTVDSTEFLSSSAGYGYSGGVATWSWATGFTFVSSSASGTIVF